MEERFQGWVGGQRIVSRQVTVFFVRQIGSMRQQDYLSELVGFQIRRYEQQFVRDKFVVFFNVENLGLKNFKISGWFSVFKMRGLSMGILDVKIELVLKIVQFIFLGESGGNRGLERERISLELQVRWEWGQGSSLFCI